MLPCVIFFLVFNTLKKIFFLFFSLITVFNFIYLFICFLSFFPFFLPFLLSRVADWVLVLWPGVRSVPLRWESRVQNTGPPESS